MGLGSKLIHSLFPPLPSLVAKPDLACGHRSAIQPLLTYSRGILLFGPSFERQTVLHMEVFSSASRNSIVFALISCTLSTVLAFFKSGAAAAAYTIAYSVIAAQTLDALRSSRTRFRISCTLRLLILISAGVF